MSEFVAEISPAALAEISFDVDAWADVEPGTGVLRSFVKPRDL